MSENVVVEEVGDVVPPQPKNEPSLEALGDLGCDFCMVVLESLDSLEKVRMGGCDDDRTGPSSFIVCGGKGLFENMDIVADRE